MLERCFTSICGRRIHGQSKAGYITEERTLRKCLEATFNGEEDDGDGRITAVLMAIIIRVEFKFMV